MKMIPTTIETLKNKLTRMVTIHVGLSLTFAAVIFGFTLLLTPFLSFLCGSWLFLANFVILFWAWRCIFEKKWVAIAVSVMITKYLILGIILYYVVNSKEVDTLWFAVGLGSGIFTFFVYSLLQKPRPKSVSR